MSLLGTTIKNSFNIRNSVIAAYERQGLVDKVLELFQQMDSEGIKPDLVTW